MTMNHRSAVQLRVGSLISILVLGVPAAADILRVDFNAGSTTGTGLGSGWGTSAFKYLQDALEVAVSGDQLWVADGAYIPTDGLDSPPSDARAATLSIPAGVRVYGGFDGSGDEDDLADRDVINNPAAILSGNLGSSGNSYHVATIAGGGSGVQARLDGFTVTLGRANGTGSNQNIGAGLLIHWAAAIVNCRLIDNEATENGGAAWVEGTQPVHFVNCVFGNNASTSGSGGAVALNQSRDQLRFREFSNCLFHDNEAEDFGAAIFQQAFIESAIRNCTFAQNRLESDNPNFNSQTIYFQAGSNVHSTITSNIRNTIIWGNGTDEDGGTSIRSNGLIVHVDILSSDVQGTIDFGQPPANTGTVSVVNVDPDYEAPANDNFRLTFFSPSQVLNAGSNTQVPFDALDVDDNAVTSAPTPDLDLTLRIAECVVDLGSYELKDPCVGDLDGDEDVDGADLGILLLAWGICSGTCPADFNCDGVVDGTDLGILLTGWTGTETHPRTCGGGESFAGGGGSSGASEAEAALAQLLNALGLEDFESFIIWMNAIGPANAIAAIEEIMNGG
jgi:hypothetical protein